MEYERIPLHSFRQEPSHLLCEYRMKPLHLWFILQGSPEEFADILKKRQRYNHRNPEPVSSDGPVFGTPANCLLGTQPPWPVFHVVKVPIYHVPIPFQLISAKRINEETRAAGELFDKELFRIFKERGLPLPWSQEHRKLFGTPRPVFDALAVYVSYVEFDAFMPEEDFLWECALAPSRIIAEILADPTQATELADMIASAIEINFKGGY